MELTKVKDYFLDLLYPSGYKCIFCGDEIFNDNQYLTCCNCLKELHRIEKPCEKCGNALHENDLAKVCNSCKGKNLYFEQAIAPFEYKDKISTAVQNLKFSNAKYLAKPLAKFLDAEIPKLKYKPEIIIPVPMHKNKKKIRGYNQCELLAKELSKFSNIETSFDVLYKIKDTKEQVKLDFNERQNNLENCFVIKNKAKIKDKVVLLIDDVYTTGATVRNCARKLLEGSARKVVVLTIAHTVLKN